MSELTFTLSDTDVNRIASAVAAKLYVPEKSIYTIPELMDKLQLSRDTITDRIRKGQFGNVIRDGRTYRIPAAGVQHYIDQHSGTAYHKANKAAPIKIHANPGKI
jgi:predicted DNA-binding transcriptional regulator AlpA